MRLALLLSTVLCVYAVDTKTWEQGSMEDFDQGTLQHLSLSSDGRLAVAPRVREVYDSSTAVLWAVARDSKGNIYTGGGSLGGSRAKLFASILKASENCWPSWTESQSRRSPSIVKIACTRPHRRTGKYTEWTRPEKRTCSTIPRPSTSGRWRSLKMAICTSPPETAERSIA